VGCQSGPDIHLNTESKEKEKGGRTVDGSILKKYEIPTKSLAEGRKGSTVDRKEGTRTPGPVPGKRSGGKVLNQRQKKKRAKLRSSYRRGPGLTVDFRLSREKEAGEIKQRGEDPREESEVLPTAKPHPLLELRSASAWRPHVTGKEM